MAVTSVRGEVEVGSDKNGGATGATGERKRVESGRGRPHCNANVMGIIHDLDARGASEGAAWARECRHEYAGGTDGM